MSRLEEKYKQEVIQLRAEIKKLVTEINAIKTERNAVIKAHADLLAECQELKMELKLCKARMGDE